MLYYCSVIYYYNYCRKRHYRYWYHIVLYFCSGNYCLSNCVTASSANSSTNRNASRPSLSTPFVILPAIPPPGTQVLVDYRPRYNNRVVPRTKFPPPPSTADTTHPHSLLPTPPNENSKRNEIIGNYWQEVKGKSFILSWY